MGRWAGILLKTCNGSGNCIWGESNSRHYEHCKCIGCVVVIDSIHWHANFTLQVKVPQTPTPKGSWWSCHARQRLIANLRCSYRKSWERAQRKTAPACPIPICRSPYSQVSRSWWGLGHRSTSQSMVHLGNKVARSGMKGLTRSAESFMRDCLHHSRGTILQTSGMPCYSNSTMKRGGEWHYLWGLLCTL